MSQRREDHSGVKSLTVHKKERRKLAQSSYWVYTCNKSAHPEDRTEAPMTIQIKQVYHENLAEIRPVKRVTPRGRGRLCNVQTTPLYVSNSVFVSSEIRVRSFITLSQSHSLGRGFVSFKSVMARGKKPLLFSPSGSFHAACHFCRIPRPRQSLKLQKYEFFSGSSPRCKWQARRRTVLAADNMVCAIFPRSMPWIVESTSRTDSSGSFEASNFF